MENPFLNSGDTAQQNRKIQLQSNINIKQQIFTQSRSYGSKSDPNRSSSNKRYQLVRKTGLTHQMASLQGINTSVHQNYGRNNWNRNKNRNCSQDSSPNYHQESANYTNGQGQRQRQEYRQGYRHGDSLAASNRSINESIFNRQCSNLNSTASVYNIRAYSDWDPQEQKQEHKQEQEQEQLEEHQHLGGSLHLEMQPLKTWRSHQLNVSAPSFTPARNSATSGSISTLTSGARRSQIHHIMPSQSQPQLHSHSHSHSHSQPSSHSQSSRNSSVSVSVSVSGRNIVTGQRRQQLPDLFQAVLKLMRELNRSVSYPKMIGMLSMRLQRLPVELKRHIPHTLHEAVANGYLRKDGNHYTLVSELEQKEIIKRNQEAAKRAKELEKEPLSWRIR